MKAGKYYALFHKDCHNEIKKHWNPRIFAGFSAFFEIKRFLCMSFVQQRTKGGFPKWAVTVIIRFPAY